MSPNRSCLSTPCRTNMFIPHRCTPRPLGSSSSASSAHLPKTDTDAPRHTHPGPPPSLKAPSIWLTKQPEPALPVCSGPPPPTVSNQRSDPCFDSSPFGRPLARFGVLPPGGDKDWTREWAGGPGLHDRKLLPAYHVLRTASDPSAQHILGLAATTRRRDIIKRYNSS